MQNYTHKKVLYTRTNTMSFSAQSTEEKYLSMELIPD